MKGAMESKSKALLTKEFQDVLKIVAERMTTHKVEWALIGSTNCALQGMKVSPKDLDVVVKLEDLRRMSEVFDGYAVSPVEELTAMGLSNEPAWEVRVGIGGAPVQILGEKNIGEYVSKLIAKRIIEIKDEESAILCLTLDAEADAYTETNRPQKAERIMEFLQTRK
jgi:hypothetical protein